MNGSLRRARANLCNQRGVAMVTVLFIGAALTVVSSAAAFATIQEFRAGADDRKAAEAISYAEAGIDRMLSYLKSGLVTFNQLNRSGCQDPVLQLPVGSVGVGTFTTNIRVFDPAAVGANRLPIAPSSGACANRPISPHPGMGNDLTWFMITSTGNHPDAARELRQVVALTPIGLPIGVYGHEFDPSAHPEYDSVSVISETTYTDRAKTLMVGNDSYYKISDFFPGVGTGKLLTDPVPAAIHAVSGISLKNSGTPEFTGPPNGTKNCTANGTTIPGAVISQSLWDSDGSLGSGTITSTCAGQTGYPTTSKFTDEQRQSFAKPRLTAEDHQVMKEAAQRYGVYCTFAGAGPGATGTNSCTVKGVLAGGTDYFTYVNDVLNTPRNTFVTYFEFRSGTASANEISNLPEVWGCSDDPALNKSVVVIVKNGGADWGGAGQTRRFNGALIVDGDFSTQGSFTFNGTMVVLGKISLGSSASEATLDPCWVRNMPGPFFRAVPGHWSEVDR